MTFYNEDDGTDCRCEDFSMPCYNKSVMSVVYQVIRKPDVAVS